MSIVTPALAGVAATPVTRNLERPLLDTVAEVTRRALADANIEAREVDGLFVTPAAMSGEPWMMFAAQLGEYLGFETKALGSYENGGLTALVALRAAMDAVMLGRVKVALVLASDTRPELDMAHFQAFMKDVTQRTIGLHGAVNGLLGLGAPVPIYAMSHQRYLYEHGLDEADVARVSVQLRAHAVDHPLAQFRTPITVEDVLSSKVLSPPIRLLQAAGISSGVAAVLVTSTDRAGADGRPVVALRGYGEHHEPSHFIAQRGSLTRFEAVEKAAAEALADAGLTASDVDVAEVYGVFGATELILYEGLGFCERGRAAAFVAEGRSTFGGDVVINPTGGRMSLGHPAGATPLYEVVEVARQLRGDALGRQVDDARIGLVQAEHGMMNGSAVLLFERRG